MDVAMAQDALVECPTGLVYVPLDVTQGVPPFDFDPNPLVDFVNSGCDSTNSSCVVSEILQGHLRILRCDRQMSAWAL